VLCAKCGIEIQDTPNIKGNVEGHCPYCFARLSDDEKYRLGFLRAVRDHGAGKDHSPPLVDEDYLSGYEDGWYRIIHGVVSDRAVGVLSGEETNRIGEELIIRLRERILVLVGAEGMSEAKDAPWLREEGGADAMRLFAERSNITYDEALRLTMDHNMRPYWLVSIGPDAPEKVWWRATAHRRVVRLED